MRARIVRVLLFLSTAPAVLQAGCISTTDFQAIAQGQFISFVNALLNSVTSDLIRSAIGGA